jgi:ABC transporter substrate binding protein (PQQ-dependent alcohol dehydrogenase system)
MRSMGQVVREGGLSLWVVGALAVVCGSMPPLAAPSVAQEAPAAQPQDVAALKIGYLRQAVKAPLPLSALDIPPDDDGLAGARLAIRDNATTGRFMKQDFQLVEAEVPVGGDAVAALKKMVGDGARFVVLDAPAETVVALADAVKGEDVLLFNAAAADDALRGESCRANVLHTAPSRAMLADALAQYLMWKQWDQWFLIRGSHPADQLLADAYRRAATRFGGKIVEERVYEDTGSARRTDSGHVQVQKQMPVFTQEAESHDIIVVADESQVFGEYLPYRTWEPSLVVGSAGLTATSWHPAFEQWGASQLQSRFQRAAKRTMRPLDYQAWMAIRAIGEGATRTKSVAFAPIRDFIRGPGFGLAAFKGQGLTFRAWDGQLRQPIILATQKLPVTVSPQEGYLHRVNELDTLGFDEPETTCRLGG